MTYILDEDSATGLRASILNEDADIIDAKLVISTNTRWSARRWHKIS
jgi:hypothetical protein